MMVNKEEPKRLICESEDCNNYAKYETDFGIYYCESCMKERLNYWRLDKN